HQGSPSMTEFASLQELDRQHVWHHLTQHQNFDTAAPPMMVRGEGLHVWDAQGRRYLDATSGGVWCVNVGYGRQAIADAVRDQLVQLNYFAGTAGTPVAARFAESLI